MRPWRRRRAPEQPTPADEAIEISARQREQAARRAEEFGRLAERMRHMRERNHLGEAFERAFGKGAR